MCAVLRGIDERDYRDLAGSLELKGRRRSSLSAMMELRHLALVACPSGASATAGWWDLWVLWRRRQAMAR
jgi:hypothetical protein